MKASIFVLGAVLLVFYLDLGNAVEQQVNPASLTNIQSTTVTPLSGENKKPGNNSVVVLDHTRIKRRACRYQEHWTHQCRNDCECARHRYCSSYGFCHERGRQRRQDDDYPEEDEETK